MVATMTKRKYEVGERVVLNWPNECLGCGRPLPIVEGVIAELPTSVDFYYVDLGCADGHCVSAYEDEILGLAVTS